MVGHFSNFGNFSHFWKFKISDLMWSVHCTSPPRVFFFHHFPIPSSTTMGSISGGGGGGAGCCTEMAGRSSKRWRCKRKCICSSGMVFFLATSAVYGSIGWFYIWLTVSPYYRPGVTSLGCRDDGEGSWSIGVFYGDSPFSLKPVETRNVWKDEKAAWPIANPVLTCASVSDAGFPSNFVADPFLFAQDDSLYMFYETKNPTTLQGDIGAAKSLDNGITWLPLGIALDEPWHLSFPYVFAYHDQVYMMPESSEKGELRLYRAVDFPLRWTLEKIVMKKPLVDAVVVSRGAKYWLFGSDHSGLRSKKNGHLEIWHAPSPLGPWSPHRSNPVRNSGGSSGARNGGRPFTYKGDLYRVGQDCGETYGRRVRLFRVDVLTEDDYKETEVPTGFRESGKGRNAWNGARHHHLDAHRLPAGGWVAAMDGDRAPSMDAARRLLLGSASVALSVIISLLLALLLGAVTCLVPLDRWTKKPHSLSSAASRLCRRLNRTVRTKVGPNTALGRAVVALAVLAGLGFLCLGVGIIYADERAAEAYPVTGYYSQFTLLTMTYSARLWNLRMYVRHYSRCSSVGEIVVVWNEGEAPEAAGFDSAVPVRVRREGRNSLNNRFRPDPLVRTRAVLELDDDIMMPCGDLERGFAAWRADPGRMVGFYPRLVGGGPRPRYRGERYARRHGGYNVILTGAVFLDGGPEFERYWGEEARGGREMVDRWFNCEDLLMNFLHANATWPSRGVEYIRPTWAIDTSKLSGAAISRDTRAHYRTRSQCLERFSEMYGGMAGRKWPFSGRGDGWDL